MRRFGLILLALTSLSLASGCCFFELSPKSARDVAAVR
jgi:hypothetical protein